MKRRLLTIISAASLLLCAVTCGLWAWSYNTDGQRRFAIEGNSQYALALSNGTAVVWDTSRIVEIYYSPDAAVMDAEAQRGPFKAPFSENWSGFSSSWEDMFYEAWYLERSFVGTIRIGGATRARMGTLSEDETFETNFLKFPLWCAASVFALLPILYVGTRWRAASLQRRGFCPACGYDLRATLDRCPECGAVPTTGYAR